MTAGCMLSIVWAWKLGQKPRILHSPGEVEATCQNPRSEHPSVVTQHERQHPVNTGIKCSSHRRVVLGLLAVRDWTRVLYLFTQVKRLTKSPHKQICQIGIRMTFKRAVFISLCLLALAMLSDARHKPDLAAYAPRSQPSPIEVGIKQNRFAANHAKPFSWEDPDLQKLLWAGRTKPESPADGGYIVKRQTDLATVYGPAIRLLSCLACAEGATSTDGIALLDLLTTPYLISQMLLTPDQLVDRCIFYSSVKNPPQEGLYNLSDRATAFACMYGFVTIWASELQDCTSGMLC